MNGRTMHGLLTPSDFENRSKSFMIELVQWLHIRTLCFQFGDCSSSHSQTRVFTSYGRTDGCMGGGPLTPDDLKNRSMSCMSEHVQCLHIKNVCFELGTLAVLKLEYSQACEQLYIQSWPLVILKIVPHHACVNWYKGFI
jgi:hypothetical protein